MKKIKLFEDYFLNESTVPSRDEMMRLISIKFPNIWLKKSEDFYKDKSKNTGIWTGSEGSTFVDNDKKIPAFNLAGSYGYNILHSPGKKKIYIEEVHFKLYNFLKENGWYAEPYDAGTVFLYPINNK